MKKGFYGKSFLYAAASLLLAALAVAQAPATSKTVKTRDAASGQASGREAQSGMSTGRRQYQPFPNREASGAAPANPEAGNGAQTAREASSGMATGRRQYGPRPSSETASGHATGREASSGQASGREAQSGMSTGRRQYEPSLTREETSAAPTSPEAASGVQTAREASSGMATGRKSGSIQAGDFNRGPNAKSSAHATETLDAAPGGSGVPAQTSKGSNPLYKESGSAGVNPLYESKDKTAAAPEPNATGHAVVEYKDGEDGTMRYRPGNNKTAKTADKTKGTTR